MTTVLCTLYNSLYLDKGLVLYDSLCESSKDFKLYVLCMDDKCYDVLTDLNQEQHIPVRLSDFEEGDEDLLKAKGNRSMGEYCWTCSSSFILYVLKHYREPICTYIDADMYFYKDPQILVDEMNDAGKSVMVVPHRFPKEMAKLTKQVGKYCVEFNTFKNDAAGLEVLKYWRNRCLECCSNIGDGIHWGDQKYLEEFETKFESIHVCNNPGAGIAPWNISLFIQSGLKKWGVLIYKPTGSNIDMIFYHFQGIQYFDRFEVYTGIKANRVSIDYNVVDYYYVDYLFKIEDKKELLEERYHINSLINKHPTARVFCKKMQALKNNIFYKKLLSVYQIINKVEPYIIRLN